jgi:hypothetical protein
MPSTHVAATQMLALQKGNPGLVQSVLALHPTHCPAALAFDGSPQTCPPPELHVPPWGT